MPIDYVNEDGSFDHEKLDAQIVTIAGEEFKDTKALTNTPNVDTLIKRYLDADKKINQKLEGVIQKPSEKATDQEKAEYRQSLLKELGAPDSEETYEFPRVEGMEYDEDAEKVFRAFFKDQSMPLDLGNGLVALFNKVQMGRQEAFQKAQDAAFDEAAKSLRNDWKGDSLVTNLKTAYAAIVEFGTEDLTKLLKDAKIYDSAGDLAKWREVAFAPEQLRVWHNIGVKMKSDEHLSNEGSGAKGGTEKSVGQKALAGIYTHPDSQAMVSKSNL